jgi:hypothetical protein
MQARRSKRAVENPASRTIFIDSRKSSLRESLLYDFLDGFAPTMKRRQTARQTSGIEESRDWLAICS